jgi:hypothetical protein
MKNRVLISNIRITLRRRLSGFFLLPAVLLSLASCAPPVGSGDGNEGNLTISLGTAGGGRAVTSGRDLPSDVLAAMRYDLALTGPGGEVLERSVSGGQTLSLMVAAGDWRIDAAAYQDEGALAGTGSLSFTVGPRGASVMVPMNMNGPCYVITLSNDMLRSNFTAAFPGTNITITAEQSPDLFFDENSLKAEESGTFNPVASGPGTSHSFTMPAADVEVSANFERIVRYVRAGGAGSKDGTSWENASDDLQKMMDQSEVSARLVFKPCMVKVGVGTYKPQYAPDPNGYGIPETHLPSDGRTTRDMAFILRKGVQVLGGYPAGGGGVRNPNPATNNTILSGDIGISNNDTDNAYHVVLAVNIPASVGTVLDGLTISGGNASGSSNIMVDGVQIKQEQGGGMHNDTSSPALVNVRISGNSAEYGGGGGMYNNGSSPVLVNVSISGNNSFYYSSGGGMYNRASSPVLVNTVISGNSAKSNGGGMYNESSSSPVLVNTVISGNSVADYDGGGMYNENSSSPVLVNTTISGNSAMSGNGGGIFNDAGSLSTVRNSIIWGNTAATSPGIAGLANRESSIVTDGSTGTGGNISAPSTNTLFETWIDPASSSMPNTLGDYRLQTGSPAINMGDNYCYPADADDTFVFPTGLSAEAKAAINAALPKDLGGNGRFNGTIDMGAYER